MVFINAFPTTDVSKPHNTFPELLWQREGTKVQIKGKELTKITKGKLVSLAAVAALQGSIKATYLSFCSPINWRGSRYHDFVISYCLISYLMIIHHLLPRSMIPSSSSCRLDAAQYRIAGLQQSLSRSVYPGRVGPSKPLGYSIK